MKQLFLLLAVALLAFDTMAADPKNTREQLEKNPSFETREMPQRHRQELQTELQRSATAPKLRAAATVTTNLLDSIITKDSDGIYVEKIESAYDANGNQTLYTYCHWGNYKYEYAYDANGNQTLYTYYLWNSVLNQWIVTSKYEFAYDANGNETLYATYDWDRVLNQWIFNYKLEYAYNADGNRTLYAYYRWDSVLNQWIVRTKEEYTYTYNADGSVATMIDTYGSTSYYYYSLYVLPAAMNTPQSTILVSVYPNPVAHTLHIKVEQGNIQAKLYNQYGQLLLQTSESQINFSSFPAGIYMLDVNGERMKVIKSN